MSISVFIEARHLLPQSFEFRRPLLLPGASVGTAALLLLSRCSVLFGKPAAPPPAAGFFVFRAVALDPESSLRFLPAFFRVKGRPSSHLDPVMRIGDQIAEGIRFHQGATARQAREAAIEMMAQVGFAQPARQYGNYPHEFSGGMRQRAMIAAALSCRPKILIADEPTTALDVTIQAQILELLLELRDRLGLSVILITHDLGIVAQTCDRIAMMQNGQLVEQGEKRQVLSAPKADYTRMLIGSHPSLPAAGDGVSICPPVAGHRSPPRPLLEVDDLHVRFHTGGSFLPAGSKTVSAVKGVSLQVMPGDAIGIVGESGSGKSTLARAILGLTPISSGHVTFDGVDLS